MRLSWQRLAAVLATATILVTVPSCSKLRSLAERAGVRAAPPMLTPPSVDVLPSGVSIADIAAKVTPSVVNVFSEKKVTATFGFTPFATDPFFRWFFGREGNESPRPTERRENSLGSGVIVSPDGVIVTNDHVVDKADQIRVALKDGRELSAKLVGADPKTDVAVLRVNAKNLPALPVADSSKVRIGDLVLAVGDPFGVGQTVTMGIVSAVGRANLGLADYEDFIQTDAAINPGNSGGALVDMSGHLLGINTAIMSKSGGYQGIGFAIPSDMAMKVKDQILEHGKVTRGWLGVAIQDVSPDLGEAMHLAPNRGVLVSDVTPGSPAEKAGLKRGDVIERVDESAVNDTGHLRNAIAFAGAGKTVSIELMRNGKSKTLQATLGEAPADRGASSASGDTGSGTGVFSGLSVGSLDATTRERAGVPKNVDGVVVSAVDPGSPAARALQPGDVIVEVDRAPTGDVNAFEKAVRAAGKHALLLVYRDGVTHYVALASS